MSIYSKRPLKGVPYGGVGVTYDRIDVLVTVDGNRNSTKCIELLDNHILPVVDNAIRSHPFISPSQCHPLLKIYQYLE